MMMNGDELLTTTQVARITGLSVSQLQRLIEKGILPSYRLGRGRIRLIKREEMAQVLGNLYEQSKL